MSTHRRLSAGIAIGTATLVLAMAGPFGCGSDNGSPQLPGQAGASPSPSPSPSPSVSPSPLQAWSQVAEKTLCEALNPTACRGIYGFQVTPDGTFQVGPAPNGAVLKGSLTADELNALNARASTLAGEDLSAGPTCALGSGGPPGTADTVTLKLAAASSPIDVYLQAVLGQGGECFRGNQADSFALHDEMQTLLAAHYPTPFPSGAPIANDEWGGDGAQLDESASHGDFKFGCAHGTTDGPITTDGNGAFTQSGTYFNDAGPIPAGDPRHYPATYSGTVTGDLMTLNVKYTAFGGQPQSLDFTLTRGQPATLTTVCPLAQ